ncbi:unnamed protein product [Ranitomeya imitator]|uniref:Reverse transcriptase domain-containing protein n=1 Tax=Ranitomeya imitator TaxID=111125 RepID=A0ABN9LGD3_9NEOB|nr:unnamed protein product [Ranitomeya imitator]
MNGPEEETYMKNPSGFSFKKVKRWSMYKFAYAGATLDPIAVPHVCTKKSSSKRKKFSLSTKFKRSRQRSCVFLSMPTSCNEVGIDRNTHDLCLDLLNLVLRENFFLFEDNFFVQTCGTAMGSNVAPAYANLYMDHFEREHVYANPIFQQNALVWYRYIDDIFCIWQGNHTSLQGFYDAINTTLPELTFTLTHHDSEITFLDTKVLKNPLGILSTDLYSKPMDCNSLLLYNSCHPKPTKDSLPRSQFKRVSRIVSDPDLKATRLQEMSNKFRARNYPLDLLKTESTRILNETENDTIKIQKNPRLPFKYLCEIHPGAECQSKAPD